MLTSVAKRRFPDWKSKVLFLLFMLLLLLFLFRCLWFCLSTRPDFTHGLSPQNPFFFEKSRMPLQSFTGQDGQFLFDSAHLHPPEVRPMALSRNQTSS